MNRRLGPVTVLVSSMTLACEGPPSGPSVTPPVRDPDFELLAAPQATTSVEIKSEHLTGILPNGVAVEVRVKATAQGTDPSSLTGEGRHFASTGAHNYWPATGSTDGTTATLSGAVTESNVAFLIGSPVEVVANATTEVITLTFGPLTGGPFAGRTLLFTGSGQVSIATP